jgi:hypothetical protein
MRPHGRASISAKSPQAVAICQRCGFMYNKVDLQWQYDWNRGPRLFNQGIQVCQSCLDVPQQSGRTIVLPPDPLTIDYALPEDYAGADNPLTTLGWNPANAFTPLPLQSLGANIGNMTLNGGVNAAFDGVVNKRSPASAALSISNSSFNNTLGKNWNAYPSGIRTTITSSVTPVSHILGQVTLYAPNDAKFLNSISGVTAFNIDGSSDASTWTTLVSGATTGSIGETVTVTATSTTSYQYHRLNMQGDGAAAIAVAQLVFNVRDAVPNDI